MKYCPQCQQTYRDESLNFCLSDGSVLLSSGNPSLEETVLRSSPFVAGPSPTVKQGVNPLFAYLAIGLLALVTGGSLMAWLKTGSSTPSNVVPPSNVAATSTNSSAPNLTDSKEPVNNRNGAVVQYSDANLPQLTAESVHNILNAWVQAQNARSFYTYQSCYDPSFVGVKTVKNGHSRTYSYSSWMADRRKMLAQAVNLSVQMSNLRVRVDGDTAVAEFDQYYRSLKYSDWGPKEIRVKMTPSGAKIVREELKSSNPL